jgi:hypothetical protein
MSRNDIDIAVNWAANEGWNPGLHDADSFYSTDPNGFLMGRLDDEPVSIVSAIRYGDTFGFIGFYIVKPEFRGSGYGMQVWKAGMKRLEGRNIGLDGVIEQQSNYQKSNFNFAYNNIRQRGNVGDILKVKRKPTNTNIFSDNFQIADLASISFDEIEKYDRRFFPDDRKAFLKSWLNQSGKIGLGIISNGALCGWGMIRPCREGYKIGPLYADQPSQAEYLFVELAMRIEPSSSIFLDTPKINNQAISLASKYGMTPVFETARMYTKAAPDLPMEKYFGVTSFELG